MNAYLFVGFGLSLALVGAQPSAPDPKWRPSNNGEWGILGECVGFWEGCTSGYDPACPDILCGTCTAISPFISNCCASTDQGNCLPGGSAYINTTPIPDFPLTTIPSSILASSSSVSDNAHACAYAAAWWEGCSMRTSSFYSLAASVQSSCLCVAALDTSSFDTAFHTDATSCYEYLTIAAPSLAAGFSSALFGFCNKDHATGAPLTATAAPTTLAGGTSSATPSATLGTPKATASSPASKTTFSFILLACSFLVATFDVTSGGT